MDTIYCDTCVFRDEFEWRAGRSFIHFGEEAKRLLDKVRKGEYRLVVSDHLAHQLQTFPQYKAIVDLVSHQKNLIYTTTDVAVKKNANEMVKLNPEVEYEDALHAELAIKGGATTLATRNIEHFAPYNSKITIRFPENVGMW